MNVHPDALRVPSIHLNGTDRTTLVNDYKTAHLAVLDAIDAVRKITVHGRDYYMQQGNAYNEAAAQHRTRLLALEDIRQELEYIQRRLSADFDDPANE